MSDLRLIIDHDVTDPTKRGRQFVFYWERGPRGAAMFFWGNGNVSWGLMTGRQHHFAIQDEPFGVWERWPSRLLQTLVDFPRWPRLVK